MIPHLNFVLVNSCFEDQLLAIISYIISISTNQMKATTAICLQEGTFQLHYGTKK